MKAIITVGVSASGKTTWAKEFVSKNPGWVIVCRDDIRVEIMNSDGQEFSWKKWNWKRENEVTERANWKLKETADKKQNVIIADTNLNEDRKELLISRLYALGFHTVEERFFDVTFEQACERDAARQNGVGYSVIARQFEQLNAYKEKPQKSPFKETVVIFDIDGTLAHMNNLRGPFEWDKIDCDHVDDAVAEINRMISVKYKVLIVSGRDEICRSKTEQWLYINGICFSELHMRQQGDMRKDTVVKKEILDQLLERYNILFVVDDRPSVCRMWRDNGIKTLQVGNPYVEF